MKRIEDAKNIQNKIQEYLGMQNADGNVASITVPRLIPLKFNTVWSSDPALVETVHCLSYGSLMPRQIDLPKTELRITTSPFILDEELAFISRGLEEHEISKGIDQSVKIFKSDGLECSLITKILRIELSQIQSNTIEKLASIEHVATVAGAKNIAIFIKNELLAEDVLRDLEQDIFKKEIIDEDAYKEYTIMTRKCKKPSNELADENVVFEVTEIANIYESSFSNAYSIIIRDEDNIIHGGATGNFLVNNSNELPYSNIDKFFISETVRGTGLGKIIMEQIENYVKSMEIHEIRLNTHEYQAPEFYKKMGYELIETHEDFIDGWASYNFVKKLAAPEELTQVEVTCSGDVDVTNS